MNDPHAVPGTEATEADAATPPGDHQPDGERASAGSDRSTESVDSDRSEQDSTERQPEAAPKATGIRDVRTIDGLLRYASGRSGRFTIPPAVRDGITNDDTPVVDLRAEIEELASQDPLLKVPVHLLAAVDRAQGSLKFRRRCLSAVALGLLSSPALRDVAGLDSALLYEGIGEPAELLEQVAQHLPAVGPPSGADDKKWKNAERKEFAENGILAIAYYFALQRDWSDTTLAKHLQPVLWAGALDAARTNKRESTRALLVEAIPGALGTVSNAWRSEIEDAEDRARGAERLRTLAEEEREVAQLAQSKAESEARELQSNLTSLEQQIEQLQQAVAQEQQARHVQSSHAVDDYESLRTRVLRLIDRQLALLEDGLHALRNGSTQVTEEYLERVIEAFVKQATALREENSPEEGTR